MMVDGKSHWNNPTSQRTASCCFTSAIPCCPVCLIATGRY
ncbi:hypothetical protein GJA_1019 [Janthinobacterium agaricidamnosum NBRC 102515 = DSM 9628]|uniref:Uncharacterized protein n=1 Tax=Janthinobacterium agaricidamnosum NBRC 102515 = DSM 9628 TaxID=1349767 RepID=W0UYM9_9BURK|nr:hypothetical protein GJA_1019 [Janthinobacterium agaricidamnosum NBRC 102515 = DSM 9628]